MGEIQEKAKAVIDFAWATDNGMSVACIPWSLLWDLRDAIESIEDENSA